MLDKQNTYKSLKYYIDIHRDSIKRSASLYEKDGKTYQIEHPNWERVGIYNYKDEEDAINSINKYYIEMAGGVARPVTEFFEVTPGLSFKEFNLYINSLDDRFAKVLVKILSKQLFEYSLELENRSSFPVHILLEEAHRYVQNDNDIEILGYNIFERIAKEGRKYGVILNQKVVNMLSLMFLMR